MVLFSAGNLLYFETKPIGQWGFICAKFQGDSGVLANRLCIFCDRVPKAV